MTLASPNAEDLRGLEGRTFADRFRLTQLIDIGGFGAVYEATDEKIPNRRVAVKLGMAVTSERAFTREAQLIGQLNNDNVVKVHDYGLESGMPYIVMDMLRGERLDSLLKQYDGRLPQDLVIKFVREIGTALDNAHQKQLVHRDLKPKNIILVNTGSLDEHGNPLLRFVLLDFGIASKIDASNSLANRTMAGAGTPEYMSPEQIACQDTTPQTDVYTFGVLLYQMLTGRVPFPLGGDSHAAIAQVITAIANDPPPAFGDVAPGTVIDEQLEALVQSCLAKRPEDRPASVREVRQEFLRLYDPRYDETSGVGLTFPPGVVQDTARKTGQTSRDWLSDTTATRPSVVVSLMGVVAVVFMAAGAVAAIWWFRQSGAQGRTLQVTGPPRIELVAGESKTFNLNIERPSDVEAVHLEPAPNSAGVTVMVPSDATEQFVECHVETDVNVRAGEFDLVMVARGGDFENEVRVVLDVKPAPYWMPTSESSFRISTGGRLISIDERNYYEKLSVQVANEPPVRFLLIDPRRTTKAIPPFYIMEDKVWVGLYSVFGKEYEFGREDKKLSNRTGVTSDNGADCDRCPAFGMTANDAYQFAKWLCPEGNLPTIQQWWMAAGYFDREKHLDYADGPFRAERGVRLPEGSLSQARPVGQSKWDVSVHGCRDMGVNGSEWTRTIYPFGQQARAFKEPELSLYLVGSALSEERLTFERAKPYFEESELFADSAEAERALPLSDNGFRVVLNPGERDER